MIDEQRMMSNKQGSMINKQWTINDEERTMINYQWSTIYERWTMNDE